MKIQGVFRGREVRKAVRASLVATPRHERRSYGSYSWGKLVFPTCTRRSPAGPGTVARLSYPHENHIEDCVNRSDVSLHLTPYEPVQVGKTSFPHLYEPRIISERNG